ncbi:hypothetical protein CP336_14910 [Pseudomonas fluorescens]|nr:hypothetical protein CP336_14910 [Pseudomonas fluorescens]
MNQTLPNDCSLPLLDTQVGLWISEQVNQAATSHNIPVRVSIDGPLDIPALQQAIDWLVQRHDNLRARFVLEGETPRQIISGTLDATLEHVVIADDERDTLAARIDALLKRPMDISRGPLLRCVLLRTGPEQHVLLFVIHHLVFDGSSIEILWRDLLARYTAITGGTDTASPLPLSYSEYVNRQKTTTPSDSLGYWLTELADRPAPQRFPCARPASGQLTRKARDVVNTLTPTTTGQLRALTGPGTFTPFMVHMAVCALLLHRHTGAEDMIFGMPLSTRDNADQKDLTGLFVNVVPLRLRLTRGLSFSGLLQHVRARVLRAMMHRHLAFHELVGHLRLGQEAGSGGLFRIFLNHASVQRLPVRVGDCTFELLPSTNITAAFEMNLAIVETDSGFDTVFEFDDMLFTPSDVAALAGDYQRILSASLSDPGAAVSDLLAPVKLACTGDDMPLAPGLPVHRWFEAQVRRAPDAVALVFQDTRLSYRALNVQANQLAGRLRAAGVSRNALVGICIERSPQMVVAILAVLKAGGAYLPIDPDNPDERIHFILQDTAVRTVLTSRHLQDRFEGQSVESIAVEEPEQFAAFDSTDPQWPVAMDDLAYCIYTSGSTGRPKGALNYHRGFANLVQWYVRDGLQMSVDDRVMLASSIGFDLTQKNILGPLCAGACLMIPAHSPANAGGFLKALTAYRPTWLNCAPSAFRAFAASPRTASLRTLVLGGEPVDRSLIEQLRGRPLTLVNSYGPTECSDVATWCKQDLQSTAVAAEMPLGQAIPGVQVYVLDEQLHLAPDGVAGEIHIAGIGVGQGYLKRPEMTEQKFIANPFGPVGSRMYKTGDLGRRRADGTLEFIGRIDFQVKIRGHRIELGEIENQLLACDGIREAVVIALDVSPGEKRLVAYLVCADQHTLDPERLSRTLRHGLPDYMVPDTWIALQRLPLNLNGKVDRKALPPPDWLQREEPATAPTETSITHPPAPQRSWTLELPRTGVSPSSRPRQRGVAAWRIEPSTLEPIERLAAHHGTTLDIALIAAFNTLLYRYSQQDEICLGYTPMRRPPGEAEGGVGNLVDTRLLRTRLRRGLSLTAVVSLTREAHAQAEQNPDADFAGVLAELARQGDHPTVEHLPVMFERGESDSPRPQSLGCDLKLLAYSAQTALEGRLEYDANQFDTETMAHLTRHFEAILKALAHTPEAPIDTLPLAPMDCPSLSLTRNATVLSAAQQLPVFQRFEEQVQRTPEATALIFEGQAWSYATLNRQANQLAWHLRAQGVGAETVVALLVERGPRLISSLLAILKAGGAYLPLDSMYPAQRIATMLDDAGVGLILTCDDLHGHLPDSALPTICLDRDREALLGQLSTDPQIEVGQQQLAYCLFTSGSTGRPKGVQIEHRALSNLLAAMQAAPGLTASDVWLSVTSAAFDIFAVEVYLPLISGARILLASKQDTSDPMALARLANEYGATVLQATPATWRMLIDSQVELTLDTAMSGGEAMDDALADGMRTFARRVWNLYGPTETTIYSSRAHIVAGQSPTLGGPVENTRLYVLDRYLNPVPVGCTGEIHIAGDGLARGYINRPDLTAERFLPDPFGPPDSRMYRTGDLARQLPDGRLIYLDRIDFQVKIRGLRIELGEIEAALRRCPCVRQAIVTAHGDDPATRKLVAYVVPRPGQTLQRDALKLQLQRVMPDYMVPSAWVFLEQLPLNVSGKIDRSRLPPPTSGETVSVATQTATQHRLAAIWAQVLQVEQVSVHDNFFALGGNSMLAIRCLVRINREFGRQLSLRTFFDHQTVEALSRFLDQQSTVSDSREVKITRWFEQPGLPDVYGFSGCGMHGIAYFQLARALASTCNFHAVEPFETYRDGEHLLGVQELANRYANAILNRGSEEPITLLGHSFGGTIAFETARLLEQQSKTVRLILLDATLIDPRVLEEQAGLCAQPDALPEWLESTEEDPGSHALQHQLRTAAQELYRQHCQIFAGYVPDGRFSGRVAVFLAQDASLRQKLRAGFVRVCQQLLLQVPELQDVPGDHMSMLTTPQVETLGALIKEELQPSPVTRPVELDRA